MQGQWRRRHQQRRRPWPSRAPFASQAAADFRAISSPAFSGLPPGLGATFLTTASVALLDAWDGVAPLASAAAMLSLVVTAGRDAGSGGHAGPVIEIALTLVMALLVMCPTCCPLFVIGPDHEDGVPRARRGWPPTCQPPHRCPPLKPEALLEGAWLSVAPELSASPGRCRSIDGGGRT